MSRSAALESGLLTELKKINQQLKKIHEALTPEVHEEMIGFKGERFVDEDDTDFYPEFE